MHLIPRKAFDLLHAGLKGSRKTELVLGPRQSGKTTLVRLCAESSGLRHLWLSGDEPDVRVQLADTTSGQLREMLSGVQLLVIDEAQRISSIGITLKLIHDEIPQIRVIATGSSALELADSLQEPLTGRKRTTILLPLSCEELVADTSRLEEQRQLENRLLYGSFPEIVTATAKERIPLLMELAESTLYKDILALNEIRKPQVLEKLLPALALQIGSQVSYQELANHCGVAIETIERYIQVLEKAWILLRLPSFRRNLRNELKKSRKIYFCDTGIRNAVLKAFQPLELRSDIGALWENYLVVERYKRNLYNRLYTNSYFWRTHAQQEIDYIEESGGQLSAFEMKWKAGNGKRHTVPSAFRKAYPDASWALIHPGNYLDFCSVF